MIKKQIRSILISFGTLCLILGVAFLVIAYGRGYRLDLRKNSLKPTGLLSTTSDPIAAQVYLNGTLRTATNNSINVDPDFYTVKIAKEGYIAWQKTIRVQGEIVTRADAFLVPTNPSLSPLTTSGVANPVLSPDGTKIAYIVPIRTSAEESVTNVGLWVLELADKPLGRNRDPYMVARADGASDFTKASIHWSPDSSQLLVTDGIRVRLFPSTKLSTYEDVTRSYEQLLKEWNTQKQIKDHQKLDGFKEDIINVASTSAKLIAFSPDETKLLYEATASAVLPLVIDPPLIGANSTEETRTISPGKLYIYDSHEDKNYFVLDAKEIPVAKPTPLPKKSQTIAQPVSFSLSDDPASKLMWFPTNRHLLLGFNGKIDIMEYDRTNWSTVYSGPFVDGFLAPWPNTSRIVILTNLNPGASTLPNLYTINLR